MISAQVGCDLREALGRLKACADAIDHKLPETAAYVIDGILRFDE